MESQKLTITKSLDIYLLITTAYQRCQFTAEHKTVGTCDDNLYVGFLTIAAHRPLKLLYVLNLVDKDIVFLSLHAMFINKGIQVAIVSDVIKLLLFLIYKDNVIRTVFGLLIFQLPEQIALTNTPLTNKDDDDVLAKRLLYLVKIRLPYDVLHIFYN